jgi:hypothetical protein
LSRGERVVGIGLGVIFGIAVVVAFVFLGSENTVDAPSIKGRLTQTAPPAPPKPKPTNKAPATVRIVDGAPPPTGPPKLSFKKGGRVRFKVLSNAAIGSVEILGLGQSRDVPPNKPVTFDFPAKRAGLFAVVVSATHIAVATIEISR